MTLNGFGEQQPQEEDRLTAHAESVRSLVEAVQLSDQMREFIATQAGQAVKNKLEAQLLENLQVLLGEADLSTGKAITAHFNMRVATSALQVIDSLISAGLEARPVIEALDEEFNNGGTHDTNLFIADWVE